MFKSFFPHPRWFFLSFLVYTTIAMLCWYSYNEPLGTWLGFDMTEKPPVMGLGFFVSDDFLLFYIYYLAAAGLFTLFWFFVSPHPWQWWSIAGSALILFITYYTVQVSVALIHWRRPFFDFFQRSVGTTGEDGVSVVAPDRTSAEVTAINENFFDLLLIFAQIAFVAVVISVLTRFFVSHYVFRWRTAMNDYYTRQWAKIRNIEGASQRIQEDTMRFAEIMENLGVGIVDAVMTLIAFLPVLWGLSRYVNELPLVGEIDRTLFYAALFWSVFGTLLLAVVGVKLPGLYFNNQRVEAAFRKELVYGEDDQARATPPSLTMLFSHVRKSYFRIYFHYMYFNIARSLYLQADNIFLIFILIPTIAAGLITIGIWQQIAAAFAQVSSSFQYLVNSWHTVVELLSVHKRLVSFEAAMERESLPEIDQHQHPA